MATPFRISENSFVVVASQVTEMLESDAITPYKFIKVSGISYDSAAAFVVYVPVFSCLYCIVVCFVVYTCTYTCVSTR